MVWGVGSLGSLYAIFGGLKAVAISDTINGVGFLIAGLAVTTLGLAAVGEGNPIAGMSTLYTEERSKFDITGDEPGSFLPFGALFTGMVVNQIFFWCTNQSIIQRALGARNLAEGQKGVLIAAGFKLLGPLVVVLPGVIAFAMFKSRLGPDDYMMAYPTLVKTVLPAPLMGMFAAVMVGAVLSTFNSVLNSAATLYSEGIYLRYINPGASGRELVRSGRICSIALALFAMFIAPVLDTSGSLYNTLQKINATFFGPMLAIILLGFTTRWVTALAAKVSLVVGPVLFYLIAFAFSDSVQRALREILGVGEDLHFLHLLALVFCITALLAVAISRIGPKTVTDKDSPPLVVDITPWRFARVTAILVSVATVLCYALLAQ